MDMIKMIKRLEKPQGKIDVILDTDTYNEIDDQFALSYMVKSPEKLNVKAIYAAPFFNEKSTGPADGMEKSYEEILRLLILLEIAAFPHEIRAHQAKHRVCRQHLTDRHNLLIQL